VYSPEVLNRSGGENLRFLCLLFSVMVSQQAIADEAYVLIDAVVLDAEAKQPTWIGLRGKWKMIHVPAGKSVVEIKPGKYRLAHIDFHKNKNGTSGSLYFPKGLASLKFHAAPNTITYFGVVDIDRSAESSGNKIGIGIRMGKRRNKKIFEWVCDTRPELFSRFPVRLFDINGAVQEVRIRCET